MSPIFQASGALPAHHPAYVERQADQEALHAALDSQYLHLIAPRQTGKTSLLKRIAFKLIGLGWRCAYVDLSTLMDLPKSDWYDRLGRTLAQYLTPDEVPSLTNQIDLRSYLLDRALSWQNAQPSIAVLFDEVEGAGKARDADGKAFSDTFFMTLRNIFIQRDEYKGIIVVALAGAVDPGDLVKDSDISPFNVGVEVALDDFTQSETLQLSKHLEKLDINVDEAVHQAIYEWTNGHPYLIQRVCAALENAVRSNGLTTITPKDVDYAVEHDLLKQSNLLRWDNNLRHVAKMINYLSPLAAQLWSQLQSGKSLTDEEVIPSIYLELYLTGAIKTQADHLIIRNRIYKKAFLKKASTELTSTLNQGGKLMNKQPRIFLSSTWQDLRPEREAVEKALHRMQDTNFAGMEYFGSRPETPVEVSLAEVNQSNIYVGIFAHRYGSGITEAEYRRARDHDLPCLIYFKDDSVPIQPTYIERDLGKLAKLEVLKQELKAHHIVSSFTSPDHLASQVVTDLHNFLRNTSIQGEAETSNGGSKYQINITHGQGIVIGDGNQVTQQYDSKFSQPQQPEPGT